MLMLNNSVKLWIISDEVDDFYMVTVRKHKLLVKVGNRLW